MITLVSRTITCASWPLPRPGGGVPPLPLAHRVSRERGLPRCADHPLGRRSRRATHPSPPEGSRRPRGVPIILPLAAPETATAPKFTSGTAPDGADAAPVPLGAPPAPESAVAVPPDGGAAGAAAGSSSHISRDSPHGPRRSPSRRPIPAAVRRHIWQRDEGCCCYRDPFTGRRCNSRSPRAAARSRKISSCRALLITACATATDRLRRRSHLGSAASMPLPWSGSRTAGTAPVRQRSDAGPCSRSHQVSLLTSPTPLPAWRRAVDAPSGAGCGISSPPNSGSPAGR